MCMPLIHRVLCQPTEPQFIHPEWTLSGRKGWYILANPFSEFFLLNSSQILGGMGFECHPHGFLKALVSPPTDTWGPGLVNLHKAASQQDENDGNKVCFCCSMSLRLSAHIHAFYTGHISGQRQGPTSLWICENPFPSQGMLCPLFLPFDPIHSSLPTPPSYIYIYDIYCT